MLRKIPSLIALFCFTIVSITPQSILAQVNIDILVLYSNQANGPDIQSHAQASIDTMNLSFINSGLDNVVRVRLVGAKHVNQNELATIDADLNWLKTSSVVASMRNSHYADVVVYIVDHFTTGNSGSVVGRATFSGPPVANRAFAVVSKSFANNPESYTFAHEVGHVAGLDHDVPASNYQFKGFQTPKTCTQGPKQYSSIMVQDGSYSTNDPIHKLNRWSDPTYEIVVYPASNSGGGGDDDDDNCSNPGNECQGKVVLACKFDFGTHNYNNSKLGWINNAPTVANFRAFATPTNLSVAPGSGFGEPNLSWNFNPTSEFDNYRVYRKRLGVNNQNCTNGSLSNYCFIGSTTSKNFTDWDVFTAGGTSETFYYAVTAVNNGIESGFSNPVSYDGEFSNFKETDEDPGTPSEFSLENNYPNPFNPSTQIKFSLPENSEVSLKIYNLMGQEISSLIDNAMEAGLHEATFEGDDLPSGFYIARIQATGVSGKIFSKEIKMQLVK